MRVSFTVHGANEAELLAEADRVLGAFSEGKRWNVDIQARPAVHNTSGAIIVWDGEVEANHEDPAPW